MLEHGGCDAGVRIRRGTVIRQLQLQEQVGLYMAIECSTINK